VSELELISGISPVVDQELLWLAQLFVLCTFLDGFVGLVFFFFGQAMLEKLKKLFVVI